MRFLMANGFSLSLTNVLPPRNSVRGKLADVITPIRSAFDATRESSYVIAGLLWLDHPDADQKLVERRRCLNNYERLLAGRGGTTCKGKGLRR